jgi:formylglycine-generating enzyme required for sulfatase activity
MSRWVWLMAVSALAQSPEFVTVPAGSFVMGCTPEWPCAETMPRKRIEFAKPFQVMRTEVTVEQFRAFAKATGYRTEAEKGGDLFTWASPGFRLQSRQPVVFLTLNDAKAYCASIGARVPVEAEWEYAARAGSATHHYWGEEMDDRYLWYFGNSPEERPSPVGRKRPNAWGLFDVEGNAMEWVQSGGPHSSISQADRGTVRGGSYASCPEPYPPENGRREIVIGLGPTFPKGKQSNFRMDERRYDFGVRCVR